MKSGRGPSKGKDFDTGNVMGPWSVTPDEMARRIRAETATWAKVIQGSSIRFE